MIQETNFESKAISSKRKYRLTTDHLMKLEHTHTQMDSQ